MVPELPQSALFTAAADLERQLDTVMASHRSHITALLGGQRRVPKKLRLMLQSRHFHQGPRPSNGSSAAGASSSNFCCQCNSMTPEAARPSGPVPITKILNNNSI